MEGGSKYEKKQQFTLFHTLTGIENGIFQNTRATVYLISQVNEVIETLQNHSKTYFYAF
jgi:hypothetical protein